MKKSKLKTLANLATIASMVYLINKALNDSKDEENKTSVTMLDDNQQAYFVGGGIASLAGAAYLIRDVGFKGKNIHIIEGMNILGGSNDGAGSIQKGFVCRGGRMLNEETYENFWELLSYIPSLEHPNRSVTEEILNFDHAHPTHAKARLIDKDANILNVKSMGFNSQDRKELVQLLGTPEKYLDYKTIQDWFSPHFFETNFWYMWQTTFAFQKWSSLFEFRRYMNRMIFEFSRIETLEGVTRTRYNQYESVIKPLEVWLQKQGVSFIMDKAVTDIDFADKAGITATTIHLSDNTKINLNKKDTCIVTNGCMTDCATLGDLNTPAPKPVLKPMSGNLWSKISAKKVGLGNPKPFFCYPKETNWESFTVTLKGDKLLKMFEEFSGNIPGNGALMTFKDSSWLMSIVIAAQPHFKAQTLDTTIFWGYGLYTDAIGDYTKKPMKDCTGEEILYELICHMHWEDKWEDIKQDVVQVIPCYMPYIDSQFQPHAIKDRPPVVPKGSTNFAMISQFVEIPKDMVFTEEYSVRAARIAVYKLYHVNKEICPVTPYNQDIKILLKALKTMYR